MAGKLRRYVVVASFMLNVFALVAVFTPLAEMLYAPLIMTGQPRAGDVIVILSGGCYDFGLPTFRSMVRMARGMQLYREKWAPKVICSGGDRAQGTGISGAAAMRNMLVSQGMPPEDIIVQDNTLNTYNDISDVVTRYARDFDFNKAIFVTSSYHTFRTRKILEAKNINAAVVSAAPYELHPVWRIERVELLKEILREYGAICYFKLKGWI
ncbi:MAG: YdcF family protein [Syntrophobacter sp.]